MNARFYPHGEVHRVTNTSSACGMPTMYAREVATTDDPVSCSRCLARLAERAADTPQITAERV